ncbi:MAG: HlyD family efflux transporter periplasmic adaptor subunit [Planctomycetota bacterium]|nr:HlyD family efflux transporter periplasmic adaptor subunit [Planctomycetota bacterium]
MSVVAPAQTAETRILPIRRRADLACHEQHIGGSRYWHVKDPVSLRYYQLSPEEHSVLMMLDGTVSLQDIRRRFEIEFAPQRLSLPQVQSFLAMLHSSGLVISDAPGQAEILVSRTRGARRQRLLTQFSNVLAIRFRGFDPYRFLNWLVPQTRFLFVPWCVTFCIGLMLSAGILAAVRIDTLQARLPHFHEFFGATNLILLAATLAVTKVLHELGHAVSCRHFGGECHEMGIMLLVFTPCLYCNVSDAWMLPSRWQRIAISAAGIYVELLLSAVCLFLWWFTVPGVFNSLCLNVVFVCSVSTLLFNGNPLLRYDGYYILSDLVEIPNLRQQAGALFRNWMSVWFLDTELANRRLLPQRRKVFLTTWHVAAWVYRLMVVWGIMWFVHRILEPYGLEPLVVVMAVLTVAGMFLSPVVSLFNLLTSPFWSRTVNWSRFRIRTLCILGLIVGGLMSPFPFSVRTPVVIRPENARSVFVHQEGTLLWTVAPGTTVEPGQKLATFQNRSLDRLIVKLEGEVAVLEQRLRNLADRRLRDGDTIDALIPATQERLEEKKNELAHRIADRERLTIRAPIAGIVIPPPAVSRAKEQTTESTELPRWNGSPLDKANLGTTLASGTELCMIGPPDQFEAIIAIDQGDVEFVVPGQKVELLIDHVPDEVLTGQIVDVAEIDLDIAPRELIEHDEFPTRLDADGIPRPLATAYQARVRLNPVASQLIVRATGLAKIHSMPQSAGQRLLRFFRQTFRFR